MNDVVEILSAPEHARLRSGTAARLAGVPVATLRVWERRYGVVAAPKTATGQRLYTPHDVQRLRLLRQLTDRGHAIGTLAGLDLRALQGLAQEVPPPTPGMAGRTLVVVGRSAAQKLRVAAGCEPQAVYDGLEAAEAALQDGVLAELAGCDLLLLHLPSLQPVTAERALALAARLRARATAIVYSFAAQALVEQLGASGVMLKREPVTGRELSRLVAAAPSADAHAQSDAAAVPPRRFTDEALAQLAEMPSSVACECPRHLAEIVQQLASFEHYSAECLSRSPADAALHRHLSALSGTARALFEQALDRVMSQEGMALR
jgi:hypothetical protein